MVNRMHALPLSRLLLMLLILLMAHSAYAASAHTSLGLQREEIRVGSMLRSYYLHVPSSLEKGSNTPLVLVLHGGGRGDGLSPAKYLGFTPLAQSEGFVVVYPNGIDNFWRDGRDHSHRSNIETEVDDIEFISTLITHLIHKNQVDPKRVYVTGISNGGIMTLRIGCELSEQVTAIAPITANVAKNIYPSCTPPNSVPILRINGLDDPMVPYHGGFVHFKRQKRGEVVATSKSILLWVKNNGCEAEPTRYYLPDRDLTDGTRILVTDYNRAQPHCGVILYTVEGGGHTLPGSDIPDMPRLLGIKNNDIKGAETIWDFFKTHSR